MMGIGYTLAGLGAAALVTGGILYATAPGDRKECVSSPCSGSGFSAARGWAGTITMIAGGGAMLIGLPFIVAGSLPDEAGKPVSAALQVGPTGAAVVGTW
jgi:hypothetical protein